MWVEMCLWSHLIEFSCFLFLKLPCVEGSYELVICIVISCGFYHA